MPNFVEPQSAALPQVNYGRGGDRIFIDFPQLTKAGETAQLILRFLPVMSDVDRFWTVMEHGLPIEVEALLYAQQNRRQSNRQRMYLLCNDFGDGPQGCGFCTFRRSLPDPAKEQLKNAGLVWTRRRVRHLALNMSDPRSHWQQAKDANGQPVLNPNNGQPHWTMMPGEFAIGAEGYTSLTQVQAMVPTAIESRDRGRLISIMKTKTGAGQTEVSYRADPGQEFPLLGSQFEPVLHNLYSIRERAGRYKNAEEWGKIVEYLKHKLGVGQASYGMPSSGLPTGYNPGMGYTGGPAPMGFPGGMPAPGMPPGAMPGAPPAPSQYAPMGVPGGMQGAPGPAFNPMGPPMGAPMGGPPPQQSYQLPAPSAIPPQQLPQVPHGATPQYLPPLQAPGMHALPGFAAQQIPPHMQPQGAPPQQGYAAPPNPGQPPMGAPPAGPPQGYAQPQYGQQVPQGAPAPQQPAGPPPMSPQELERAVGPSGGSIPF